MLVLQATNAGVRRPGYEARPDLLTSYRQDAVVNLWVITHTQH